MAMIPEIGIKTIVRETPSREIPNGEIRLKYLVALSVSLGVKEELAREISEDLLKNRERYKDLDYKKRYVNLSSEQVGRVEIIGRGFLTGSPKQDKLKFTVGFRVLGLLWESPQSAYFKDLEEWIGYWAGGEGENKFRERVGQAK